MDFLFKKTNSRYLAIIRIVLGSWFFIDLVSMLVSGYVTEAYVTSTVHFPFYGFEWIKPLPGIWMYVLYIFLSIITIGITLGYRMRLCLMIFLIGFTYVFMCDIVYTLNKFYLFLWFAFILLFTGADKALSFAKEENKSKWVPYWQVFIFQFLFVLIYTYSGISKLNPDWLFHAEPLVIFLKYKIPFKWMSAEVYQYAAFTFTYCGMFFDLTISALLVYNN
ncbi:MAG: HTTM domain-containing protein, partial [bacterium]|nr:HTTM domain-containing protein [bacterium]